MDGDYVLGTLLNFNIQCNTFCSAFRRRRIIHQFTNWS